jgi:hypothetical protein
METEREQILRELRSELTDLQKEFQKRTMGLLLRIAAELGELAPGPSEIKFASPHQTGKPKVRCGRL